MPIRQVPIIGLKWKKSMCPLVVVHRSSAGGESHQGALEAAEQFVARGTGRRGGCATQWPHLRAVRAPKVVTQGVRGRSGGWGSDSAVDDGGEGMADYW